MAFSFKSLSLSFLFLLCFLLLLQLSAAEKSVFHDSSLEEVGNRKLLMANGFDEKEAVVLNKSRKEEDEMSWELRAAPLGPDPLHHHGADPKKPRTP